MTIGKDKLIENIHDALVKYNQNIQDDGVEVRSFYLEHDEELEGWVAKIIYVVDDISRAEVMDFADTYCQKSGNALQEYVQFTYCWFRSEEDYQNDFSDSPWTTVLTKLQHAA